jgi:hypothetical protein
MMAERRVNLHKLSLLGPTADKTLLPHALVFQETTLTLACSESHLVPLRNGKPFCLVHTHDR